MRKKTIASFLCIALSVTTLLGCTSGNSVTKGNEYVDENSSITVSSVEASSSDSADEASTEASIATEESSAASEATSSEDSASTDTSSDSDDLVVVYLGDSQMDNGREDNSDIPSYVQQILGGTHYNLGVGGTVATNIAGNDNSQDANLFGFLSIFEGRYTVDECLSTDYAAYDIVQNVNLQDVDVFVLAYGINDFLAKMPRAYDYDNSNYATYRGGLTYGIDKLRMLCPNAAIIVCSPTYCYFYDVVGIVNSDGNMADLGYGPLAEYASTCEQVAEEKGCTYLDTYYGTRFDLSIYTFDKYTTDGIHLNNTGRQIYATVLARYIKLTLGTAQGSWEYPLTIDNFEFDPDIDI
ncbi:MAG: hypothetical protein E7309_04895 [Butyrivibrio sp.]|jgi:lysophospholipase L1-like esterase|nr:hypothetical protein [Butyrivibrio sp.]